MSQTTHTYLPAHRLPPLPLTLYPTWWERFKAVFLLLPSSAFLLLLGGWPGYIMGGFAGLLGLLMLFIAFQPSTLTLTLEGFEELPSGRYGLRRWDDIEVFLILPPKDNRDTSKAVGWVYLAGHEPEDTERYITDEKYRKKFPRHDGPLMYSYNLKRDSMAALLNGYLLQSRTHSLLQRR